MATHAEFPTGKVRTVVLLGHGGTGKTALGEALLALGGGGTRGGTFDFEPEEVDRGHSLSAAVATFVHQGHRINLIDTPGTADAVGDAYPALQAADVAIFVVDAVAGVQAQHDQLWQAAEHLNLPRLVFLNSLDRERAGYQRNIDALRERYGKPLAAVHMPMGVESDFTGIIDLLHATAYRLEDGEEREIEIPEERREQAERNRTALVEAIVEVDDEIMMRYLDGDTPSTKELSELFEHGVADREFFPVLCGSATLGIGVKELADFIVEECPAADERGDTSGPASAYVFKTLSDPYVGHINVLRILTGTLKADDNLTTARTGATQRLHQLFVLQGKEQTPAVAVHAGDVVAVAKLEDVRTGDVLSAPGAKPDLEPLAPPAGFHRVAIQARSAKDDDKLSTALSRLTEEDPALRVEQNPDTHQLVLHGYGPGHTSTAIARLQRKFGVHVDPIPLRLQYLETITAPAQGLGRHVKQTGGAGQYGVAHIEISPLPRGEGFTFEDGIVGGVIPREFIPSVEKGVRAQMERGVLAGYPVVDVNVRLFDGKYHSVDSKQVAFESAGALAFRIAADAAGLTLLEPVVSLEVTIPDELTGDVMGDLSSRRGRIQGTHAAGIGKTMVKAEVPEAELVAYTGDLRSLTSGQGTVEMTYSHHAEVPSNIAQKVIEAHKKDDD